jgi:nitrite reductase/ring-hydroxylating ferredoxin subunit
VIDVAAVGDLREGYPLPVRAGSRELVLMLWRGEVFALRNVCPHQTQSFAGGYVHGNVVCDGGVGTVTVRGDEPVIECPVHAWNFRLHDGRCVSDPAVRVKTYATEIRGDRVLVALGDGEAE